MSFNPLIDKFESGGFPILRNDLGISPDDCCEYCKSGWCKNPYGSMCPHYLETIDNSGGCEKALKMPDSSPLTKIKLEFLNKINKSMLNDGPPCNITKEQMIENYKKLLDAKDKLKNKHTIYTKYGD